MTVKIKEGRVDLSKVSDELLKAELQRRHPRGRPPVLYTCEFCREKIKSREFYKHLVNCEQKPKAVSA